jgi:kynurenine formamidase
VSSPLLDVIAEGITVYDLGQPLEANMPGSPNHPDFHMALIRRHGDSNRPDGTSSANELIVTGGHVGTHIDALAHVSDNGRLHGGVSAEEAQKGGRFNALGVETIEPMVCRGVLLDVASLHRVDALEGGYGVSADDLANAADRVAVQIEAGDVVLVRTGWARHWGDRTRYLGMATGVPGVTEGAAAWLAGRRIRASGTDTTAYERIAPGEGHRTLPVHRLLLVEYGCHIIEHLNLESAAAAGLADFLFVLSPLRIVGATGSPVRPLAIVGA